MGNDYGELAGNASEEHIRFCGGMVSYLAPSNTHVCFEMVNGTFYDRPDFVSGVPFIGISLETREHTKIHVPISVRGSPFFGGAAWFFAVTNPLSLYHMHFWANPFYPIRPSFFMTMTSILQVKGFLSGTGGITIKIVPHFFKGAFIPRIIGNECFGEMENIF